MAEVTGAGLENIYNRLSGVSGHHPFDADTVSSDWSIEAGDIVKVKRGDETYTSPLHSTSLTWRGAPEMTLSSTGNKERDAVAKVSKRKYSRGGGYLNDRRFYKTFHDAYEGLYSYIEMTSSRLYTTFEGMYDGLSSEFEITRSRMYADFKGMYDGLSSSFEITRSRMYADFNGLYDGLSSQFEVTRSRMYVDFRGMYDGLSSSFEVTRSRMYADFNGLYDGLSSQFEVTRSRMYVDFKGLYDGLGSEFEITRSRMYAEFHGLYDGLSSEFELTRSRMYVDFKGLYDGLGSEFELTRSRMYVDFYGLYDGLSSSFEVTRSRMYADFKDLYDGLSSSFEVTRSRMYVDFSGMYDGLSSSFEVTRSRMYVDFYGMYDGLSSSFEVTRSRMYVDFNGLYDGLGSTFEVTRSRMYVQFSGLYDGLNSTFETTRSRMYAQFSGLYDGLSSNFEVTRSRMYTQFTDLYSGLSSEFEVTASGLRSTVSDMYSGLSSKLVQQANRIGMVVDGNGNIKAAQIVASINDDGTSQSLISADKILLDGNTTVGGMMSIAEGGGLFINGNLTMASNKEIIAGDIRATDIRFPGANPGEDVTIQRGDVSGMIIKAEVDSTTNTLKLWKKGDDTSGNPSITFSKATSITGLTGSWSGGASGTFPLTISTEPSSGYTYVVDFETTSASGTNLYLYTNGTPTLNASDSKKVDAPLKISSWASGSPPTITTRWTKTITIDATAAYNAGWLAYFNAWHYPSTIESGVTSADIVVTHPGGTPDSADVTKTFTLDVANGYATVKSGNDVYARVVASATHQAPYGTAIPTYGTQETATITADGQSTIATLETTTYRPSSSSSSIYGGINLKFKDSSGDSVTIARIGSSYLVPENIKTGVSIFGISGTYTSDANATAANIASGKTAYVNGSKVTGSMANITIDYNVGSLPTGTGSAGTIPYGKYIKVSDGYHSATTYYATQTDSNLSASNIKNGVTILGTTGTFTSDANATASNIANGKTAYVNGNKITGSMTDITIDYNSSLPTGSGSAGTIPYGKYIKVSDGYHSATTYYATETDSDLTPANVKSGVTILGTTGTFTSDANATAANIASGKTAYVNGSKITGSMANITIDYNVGSLPTGTGSAGTIPYGYYIKVSEGYHSATTYYATSSAPYTVTATSLYGKNAGTISGYTKYDAGDANSTYYISGTSPHASNSSALIYGDFTITADGHTLSGSGYLGSAPTALYQKGYALGQANVHPTLSPNWSNGTLTVTSSPSASANLVRTLATGNVSWNGTTATIPINATYGSSGQYSESTGWSASLNVAGKLTTATISHTGDTTPTGSYIGFSKVTANAISIDYNVGSLPTGAGSAGTIPYGYYIKVSEGYHSATTYYATSSAPYSVTATSLYGKNAGAISGYIKYDAGDANSTYYISGTSPHASNSSARIYGDFTITADGHALSGNGYLGSAPTALYQKGYSLGVDYCWDNTSITWGNATWSKSGTTVEMQTPYTMSGPNSKSKSATPKWWAVPKAIWDDGEGQGWAAAYNKVAFGYDSTRNYFTVDYPSAVTGIASPTANFYVTASADGNAYIRLGSTTGDPVASTTFTVPSYTRYNMYVSERTQSSDGYHYTFTIGTGWSTPFANAGNYQYLYKRN